jgi:hypothetical protein
MHAFAILVVMLSRDAYFKTAINGSPETSAALRSSLIQTNARNRAGKRNQAVEPDRRAMFADEPSRVVLNRISPAGVAVQKPIFGDDFKVSQARHTWLRF